MGYHLRAIIGEQQALARHVPEFQQARVVRLAQGIGIIPLTDDLYDEIGDGGGDERFERLSPGVEKWALRMSAVGRVAYVEAEFFGGVGSQSAMAWSGAARVLGPVHAPDAINQTLRFLGVRAGEAADEFEAVGLGRCRYTDDWLEDDAP